MAKDNESGVPAAPVRKPTAKKTFSLNDFKKKIGGEDSPDKPLIWIPSSKALQQSTGLPGFPKGYVSLARGFSNTGKSTAVCEGIVSAQKMGVLPVIIDTENNLGNERLRKMGFDWDNEFFILIDNEYLLNQFGKKQDPKRKEAAIEDMAAAMFFLIDQQENGDLPYDLLFAIDSLGTLDCIKSINAQEKNTSDNNMWNAGAFEKSFKYMLNNTIPNSRKESKKYTNTVIGVQKIWIDSMGAGVVKHKGGETFFYGSRLIYHFGGIAAHGAKKVTATSKSRDIAYGIEANVNVAKNQIDGPLGGISFEGKVVSTPHGFILPDKDSIEAYKKENLGFFRDILGTDVEVGDLGDKYTDFTKEDTFEIG
jgi:hypothetical protein